MQNFEDLGRELSRRGKTEQLKALAETDDVQRLSKMVDSAAVEKAAKTGDGDALKAIPVSYTHLTLPTNNRV